MLQKVKDGFLYGLGFMAAQLLVTLSVSLLMMFLGFLMALLTYRA